jgi:hypothetical protein
MKDGMSGILQQVGLGQIRKARKSSIIRPPLLSMSIFQNSEKTVRSGVTLEVLGDEKLTEGPIQTS